MTGSPLRFVFTYINIYNNIFLTRGSNEYRFQVLVSLLTTSILEHAISTTVVIDKIGYRLTSTSTLTRHYRHL